MALATENEMKKENMVSTTTEDIDIDMEKDHYHEVILYCVK